MGRHACKRQGEGPRNRAERKEERRRTNGGRGTSSCEKETRNNKRVDEEKGKVCRWRRVRDTGGRSMDEGGPNGDEKIEKSNKGSRIKCIVEHANVWQISQDLGDPHHVDSLAVQLHHDRASLFALRNARHNEEHRKFCSKKQFPCAHCLVQEVDM